VQPKTCRSAEIDRARSLRIGSSRGLELYTLSECIKERRKGRDSFTVRVHPAVAFGSFRNQYSASPESTSQVTIRNGPIRRSTT
jgi:hypothetical protein